MPRLLPPPRSAAAANELRRLIGPMSGAVSAARGGWSARPGAATARAPRARAGPRDPRSPQKRPKTPPQAPLYAAGPAEPQASLRRGAALGPLSAEHR